MQNTMLFLRAILLATLLAASPTWAQTLIVGKVVALADGDTLTVTQVNGTAVNGGAVIALPSGALLTMNADGSYSYNPNGAFDSLGEGDTATDSFTDSFGIVDTMTAGGPARATNLMVYKIFNDGFQGLDYSGAAAQSIILMILVVSLTVVQFRYIERKVHYT